MQNLKILALYPPTFAPYPGWSILLDNPGRSIRRIDLRGRLLETDPAAPSNLLYAACWQGLKKIKSPEICALPVGSGHVTFSDGVNAENLEKLTSTHGYAEFFKELPLTTGEPLPPGLDWIQSQIAALKPWNLRLRVKDLEIFEGPAALVVLLQAADAASEATLQELRKLRRTWDEKLLADLGKPLNRSWTPHISLAYFASQEAAFAARENLEAWREILHTETAGMTLEFASMSVYAFEDMTRFWRIRTTSDGATNVGAHEYHDVIAGSVLRHFEKWWGANPKVARAAMGALLKYLTDLAQGRGPDLVGSVEEVCGSPSFDDVPEVQVLLFLAPIRSALALPGDTALLVKTKEILSQEWTVASIQAGKPCKPIERRGDSGISFVLAFDYPAEVLKAVREHLQTLQGCLSETEFHHVTLLNVRLTIDDSEVDRVLEAFSQGWQRELAQQPGLKASAKRVMQQASLRASEIRLQSDGAMLLFGSGFGFLKAVAELRLCVLAAVFPDVDGVTSSGINGKNCIWVHTVVARKVEPFPVQMNGLPTWPPPGIPQDIELRNARLALIVYKDDKAFLKPVKEVRLDLD
jgi:2'-5' RNA ligase